MITQEEIDWAVKRFEMVLARPGAKP